MCFLPVFSHCIVQVLLIVSVSYTISSGIDSLTCLGAITCRLVSNFPNALLRYLLNYTKPLCLDFHEDLFHQHLHKLQGRL